MRVFKKILSSVLSVAITASALSMLTILPATAFTSTDTQLYLDFNNSKGVADYTASAVFTTNCAELNGLDQFGYSYKKDPENSDNTTLYVWNRVYNGYSVMLGTPGCDIGEENAFALQPSTTYVVKIKYKYSAGSSIVGYNGSKTGFTNTLHFELYSGCQVAYDASKPKTYLAGLGRVDIDNMSADKYIAVDPQKNFEYNAETNNTVPETYTRKMLAEDTAWQTAEYTFTTGANITGKDKLFLSLTAGNVSISGGAWNQTDIYQYVGVYFDDIVIKSVDKNATAGEYIYDFKSNGESDYALANQYWLSNSQTDVYGLGEYGSFVDNLGMHFTSTVNGRFDGSAEWLHRFAVKDNDINIGNQEGLLKLEADTEYTVVAKYKPLNIEGGSSKFGIAVSVPGGGTYNTMSLGATQHMLAVVKSEQFTDCNGEWQYMSVVLDGDAETLSGTPNAGAYVYLTATGTADKPSTYLIEYVKVIAVKKGANPIVLKQMVRGSVIDASIVEGGEALTPPPASYGEESSGWVDSKGVYVTTAPSVSTTLTAAYPTNIYTFENGMNEIYMPVTPNLGMRLDVVDDPLIVGGNKVLKMDCTQSNGSTNNFSLGNIAGTNGDGFKPTAGKTYQILMDVYLESKNSDKSELGVWLTASGGISHTGNKNSSGNKFSTAMQNKITATTSSKTWTKVSFEYTPSSSKLESYPYMVIAYSYGNRVDSSVDNAVIYFDNIVIIEKGSADSGVSVVMFDAMGGTVAQTEFIVGKGEQINLPTPKKDGYLVCGWTNSSEMAQGTLSNTAANMNDKISPKTVIVANGSETYYAIWAEKSLEYTFGTPDETVFQNALTTEEVSSSGGYVSVGYSLYDEDGDGKYELKADQTSRDPSSYKVNLGYYNGSKNVYYALREDVTYRITMKFKVSKLQEGAARIGVGRCRQGNFAICKIEGGNAYDFDIFYETTNVTDGYITVTREYTCKGIFDIAQNGSSGSNGGAVYYKDGLFVTIGQGHVYVKSITVEALSYDHDLTKTTEGGKIKVNYSNNTLTVTPDDGYILKPGSLKFGYTRHVFDTQKYGSYNYNNEQHLSVVKELTNYSQNIFNVIDSSFGKEVYKFTNPYNYSPDATCITAEFVPVSVVSAGVIASSIRYEKTEGASYQSAGLRFRARVVDDARITEVGFIVVPTALKKSLDSLTFNSDGSINCANAIKVVAYGNGVNKFYEKGDGYTDYQVLIKELTSQNGVVNMKNTDFTVVIYAKYNDNGVKYAYSNETNASWDSVNAKYEKLK